MSSFPQFHRSPFSRKTRRTKFFYDPSHQRWKQEERTSGTLTSTTLYQNPQTDAGFRYERTTTTTSITHRHYIILGTQQLLLTEIESLTAGTAPVLQTRYLHTDALGSVEAISNGSGAIVERLSYNAFGTRRYLNGSTPTGVLLSANSNRGFTGHEMLDQAGLIHMNGRVYDPKIGRFLSADPFVQAPSNGQSLNRFAYVMNNPLGGTDPSGFFSLRKFFQRAIFGLFGNSQTGRDLITVGICVGTGNPYLCGAVSAANTAVSGGDLKATFISGAAAFTMSSIGGSKTISPSGRVFASGLVGGTSARLSGGSFQSGFLSAGFSAAAMPKVNNPFTAAIIGGTASKIGGGRFANGAKTAAFGFAVGEAKKSEAERAARSSGSIYVTGHRVGEAGPYHLALEYSDRMGPHWISAGPDDGLLVSGQNLSERPSDAPALNITIGEVTPPTGMSASDYYSALQQADRSYCDCIDYDLFPGVADSYNSNSYATGLIGATGGKAGADLTLYVGGQKPLPPKYFGQ